MRAYALRFRETEEERKRERKSARADKMAVSLLVARVGRSATVHRDGPVVSLRTLPTFPAPAANSRLEQREEPSGNERQPPAASRVLCRAPPRSGPLPRRTAVNESGLETGAIAIRRA